MPDPSGGTSSCHLPAHAPRRRPRRPAPDLILMPGPNVPFPPQQALLALELPAGERWQYEPKWDGFRGILEGLDLIPRMRIPEYRDRARNVVRR